MEITNIRGHRIRWSILAAHGAVAGLASAVLMFAIATITYPMFSSSSDGWSFVKVVSTAVLGGDAAQPLMGFAAVPVIVGLTLHLVIGAAAGVSYAFLVAMFDLQGWTPVALFGLLYGAMLFIWSAAIMGAGLGTAPMQDLPIVVMLWANIVFGLTSGILLATWADRADLDQTPAERVKAFEGNELPGHLPS